MTIAAADQEKTARFRRFWARAETDRPLLGATVATFPSMRAVRREAGVLVPEDLDVEQNARELHEEWEAWRGVMGDALFVATPLWAFPWHLALAGCPVKRDADNLWALPGLHDWGQLERVRFDPDNPWFRRLVTIMQALLQKAAGQYAVGPGPLLLGPPDLMMQLRGQDRLALDFYDAPEQVEVFGQRAVELCAAATHALYQLVPLYHGGRAGTSRYFWAPGEMVETAEDISFMTSPALHCRFVAPLHAALGSRFPYTMLHLHSAQLHTVRTLLEIDQIAAIEITPDFGEDLVPQIPVLRQILDRKPLLLHGVISTESAQTIMQALPARGFGIFFRCATPDEAASLMRTLL